jgi:hypothetical protein
MFAFTENHIPGYGRSPGAHPESGTVRSIILINSNIRSKPVTLQEPGHEAAEARSPCYQLIATILSGRRELRDGVILSLRLTPGMN